MLSPVSAHSLAQKPQIRVLHRSDLDKIVSLDEICHGGSGMTAGEICTLCHEYGHIGLLGQRGDSIDGFLLYYRTSATLEVAHVAIHPLLRYSTLEKWLFQSVIQRLLTPYRRFAHYRCHERDIGQQKLLAELGFEAKEVTRSYFGDDDAYEMVFDLEGERP